MGKQEFREPQGELARRLHELAADHGVERFHQRWLTEKTGLTKTQVNVLWWGKEPLGKSVLARLVAPFQDWEQRLRIAWAHDRASAEDAAITRAARKERAVRGAAPSETHDPLVAAVWDRLRGESEKAAFRGLLRILAAQPTTVIPLAQIAAQVAAALGRGAPADGAAPAAGS